MHSDLPLCRRIGALLIVLAGCSCPPNATAPPQFTLAFSDDTLNSSSVGFRRAEIRSAYLVRYANTDFQQLIDTLRQPTAFLGTKPTLAIYYRAQYPAQFALPDFVSQYKTAHSYRLVVPAANRSYDITNVILEQTAGSKRCDNDRLNRSEANINGQQRNGLNQIPELTK
jgi:hypothetical protein